MTGDLCSSAIYVRHAESATRRLKLLKLILDQADRGDPRQCGLYECSFPSS